MSRALVTSLPKRETQSRVTPAIEPGGAGQGELRLIRLLQLASPALPVGAFSYSQGLESAVESGVVHDAATAGRWIADMLRFSLARSEAPLLF